MQLHFSAPGELGTNDCYLVPKHPAMFTLVEKVGKYTGQPEACIETGANESPSVAAHCCCCCGTGSERELRTTAWIDDYASLYAEVPPAVQLDKP